MQQKLEEKEETAIEFGEKYQSLQQEVDVKTKKLKKVSCNCIWFLKLRKLLIFWTYIC